MLKYNKKLIVFTISIILMSILSLTVYAYSTYTDSDQYVSAYMHEELTSNDLYGYSSGDYSYSGTVFYYYYKIFHYVEDANGISRDSELEYRQDYSATLTGNEYLYSYVHANGYPAGAYHSTVGMRIRLVRSSPEADYGTVSHSFYY